MDLSWMSTPATLQWVNLFTHLSIMVTCICLVLISRNVRRLLTRPTNGPAAGNAQRSPQNTIDIIVRDSVSRQLNSGGMLDKALRSNFGGTRAAPLRRPV